MRKRVVRANIRRLWRPSLIVIALLALVGGGFFVLNKTGLGSVKEVVCQGEETVACEVLKKDLLGRKIWRVSWQEATLKAQRVDLTIKQATMTKSLNGKLAIQFEPRKALVVLMEATGNFLLDEGGFLFAKEEPLATPSATLLISGEIEEPELGIKAAAPSVLSALKIAQAFRDSGMLPLKIEDRRDYLALDLAGGVVAWFPLEADLEERIYAGLVSDLSEIISKARLERRAFRKVDLRAAKITIE